MTKRKKRPAGWLPGQHGAWAMLLLPYVVALAITLPHRPFSWGDVTLGVTWLVGYFAYNALVLTVKSPQKRRPHYRPALLVYSATTAVFGLATLASLGLEVLWWAPLYVVLLGSALRLAATKRERSLTSGIVTVLASCGLMGVLRTTAPAPISPAEAALAVAVTGYFIGTVFHIKSLIRERNEPASARRSAACHVVLGALIAGAVLVGWLSWPWAVWAALLLGRSLWLPQAFRKPPALGIVEIVASVALLLLVVAA